MPRTEYRYLYGPVYSRRLGSSLGVDVVPHKVCNFDCIYCQIGRTTLLTMERREYLPIRDILEELEEKLSKPMALDYVTLSGSGEPTLNSGIGELIDGIKNLTDTLVAVLTNGTLLGDRDVQSDLRRANLVLPSLDAGDEETFRLVNRPHPDLHFDAVIDGMAGFVQQFNGKTWLEVMLLAGITGLPSEVKKIAEIVNRIAPDRVQLNTATRPASEKSARRVSAMDLEALKSFFDLPTEVIRKDFDHAPTPAECSADFRDEVLALLRRRPCTSDDIAAGIGVHFIEVLKIIDALIDDGEIQIKETDGRAYYVAERRPSSCDLRKPTGQ
ncbi:radical SAM protein [bacterium]|nr:radical SAM protein [bacterium]